MPMRDNQKYVIPNQCLRCASSCLEMKYNLAIFSNHNTKIKHATDIDSAGHLQVQRTSYLKSLSILYFFGFCLRGLNRLGLSPKGRIWPRSPWSVKQIDHICNSSQSITNSWKDIAVVDGSPVAIKSSLPSTWCMMSVVFVLMAKHEVGSSQWCAMSNRQTVILDWNGPRISAEIIRHLSVTG
jgi:hypothetical protein